VLTDEIQDIYELTPVQQGILFHSLYEKDLQLYLTQVTFTISGDLDPMAYQWAWQRVIERHPVLRTAFVWEDVKTPLQVVYRMAEAPFDYYDWQNYTADEQEEKWSKLLIDDRKKGFDLSEAPLVRFALVRMANKRYRVLWSFHHLILDGWSLPLLLKESLDLYRADHWAEPEPSETRPFVDYIGWLAQQDVRAAEHYWKRILEGFSEPTILQVSTPLSNSESSLLFDEMELYLSEEKHSKLKEIARQSAFTLNTFVQGAWAILLSKYSGQDDVLFGTAVSGRPTDLEGFEQMVGMFMNTLPVRIKLSEGEQSVKEWLTQIQQNQVEMSLYEYSSLADIQSWSQLPSGQSLFDTLVAVENYPFDSSSCTEVQLTDLRSIERTNYSLNLVVYPENKLKLKWMWNPARFSQKSIEQMAQQFLTILEQLIEQLDQPLKKISLLTPEEQERMLTEANQTKISYPLDRLVDEWIACQAEENPDQLAVVSRTEQLTFAELNRKANQLAHYLQQKGLETGDLVGIFMERSPQWIVAVLGIMKAGGAYLPLDLSYPEERLRYMAQDAGAKWIITQRHLRSKLQDIHSSAILDLDQEKEEIEKQEGRKAPLCAKTVDQIAYLIYTSGSTGLPKGVAISHRSLLNLVFWHNREYQLSAKDRTTWIAGMAFDASVWEIWPTLVAGSTLWIPEEEVRLSPTRLQQWLIDKEITVSFLPTPLLESVMALPWSQAGSLRLLLTGGDQLRSYIPEGFPIEVVNHYGPTENTVVTTFYRVPQKSGPATMPPIGRPIANVETFVLDRHLQPVPPGVAGELYVGGVGLALEYYQKPEQTAERFIPHPFRRESGELLYRTGDLVRQLPDGNLEFLGRIDQQVKLRGFRIELGEIEAALLKHLHVFEAVAAVKTGDHQEPQLVAYVVTDQQELSSEELTDHLKKWLPSYMIPTRFIQLDQLPLTPNGKIDRNALPQPIDDEPTTIEEQHTPIAEIIHGIWCEVLQRDQIASHQSFFQLGGQSLLATQAVVRINDAFGIVLPLRIIFDYPTIALLEKEITSRLKEKNQSVLPPIQRADEQQEVFPLSYAQQRLWFLQNLIEQKDVYHIPFAIRLQGSIHHSLLKKSWEALLERQSLLRTSIFEQDGEAKQRIKPVAENWWEIRDLRQWQNPIDQAMAEIKQDAKRAFSLTNDSLIRVKLFLIDERESLLYVNMHHLISDGWSLRILLDELFTIYQALCNEEQPALAELPVQYTDYVMWQRQWLQDKQWEKQLAYWKQQLAEVPVLQLPTDYPRPAEQTFHGATYRFHLANELVEKARKLSQQEGVTLFMTMLGAFQTLLSRYSGQEDLAVGSPIANRSIEEIEGLIGFFVNTLVFRTDLSGNPSFRQLLSRVREVSLEAYAHQDVPFEKIVDELQLRRNLSHSPLFQVMFALQNIPLDLPELPDLQLNWVDVPQEVAKFDLTCNMMEESDGIVVDLEYNTDLFSEETITRMADHFTLLLTQMLEDPDRPVQEIPLLLERERQCLQQWNQTKIDFPESQPVHQLIAQQAIQQGEALAIIGQDRAWTYRELNQQANQLAHYLQSRGISSGDFVGVCMERSPEMIIGMLAIMKIGAVYVPIDPAYPSERQAYLISDAQLPLVLTQSALAEHLPDLCPFICLDRQQEELRQFPKTNPQEDVSVHQLAYMIYTSGSTGQPKGVMIRHDSLLNLVHWHIHQYQLTEEDRCTWIAGVAFDASVWEIWPTLAAGARLYLPDEEIRLSPASLRDWMIEQQITISFVPTPLLEQLLQLDWPHELALRKLLTGGDQLRVTPAEGFPVEVINHYGPTENTVVSTAGKVTTSIHSQLPTIGKPIANTEVYVLDQHFMQVPIGVPGELYVGGKGVAEGYYQRAELTAERFIPHLFSSRPHDRLYRTGDLVRFLPDGQLEFLGRIDQQVSIRGFRIELGEVEFHLSQSPQIKEAVVIAHGEGNDKRLVAYVVLQETIDRSQFDGRAYLKQRLPEYMIPSLFIVLESLPLTPNGKLDRKALPDPTEYQKRETPMLVKPRNEIERQLAEIWQEVLGIEEVGINDNFFTLGGDSILSIQVVSRANQRGLKLTPKQCFENQTIAELAAVVGTVDRLAAEQGKLQGNVPFTPIQHWFWEQNFQSPHHWNQSLLLLVRKRCNPRLLAQALDEISQHHDALRLCYRFAEGKWTQVYQEKSMCAFDYVDLTGQSMAVQKNVMEEMAAEAQASLHISEGPLFRVIYFDLGETIPGRLLFVAHHLIVDGVSWRILLEDFETVYEQLQKGEEVRLPSKTTSLRQWAEMLQQASEQIDSEELHYWRSQVQRPPISLPVDFSDGENLERTAQKLVTILNEEETEKLLTKVHLAYGTKLPEVLITALAQAVNQWTGKQSICIHLEGHGRQELGDQADLSRTVGWLTNLYPVWVDLAEPDSPGEALKTVKEQLRSVPRQGLGYGLLRYLADEKVREIFRKEPTAEISFNYLGQLDRTFSSDLFLGEAPEDQGQQMAGDLFRPHLIDVVAMVVEGRLQLAVWYSEKIHARSTIEQWMNVWLQKIRLLIDHCCLEGAGGYTPSDFSFAQLTREELDQLAFDRKTIEDLYILTPLQQGMMFHTLYGQETGDYVVQMNFTLTGQLNLSALKKAWQRVLDRYEILRSAIVWKGLRVPHQVIYRQVPVDIEVEEVSHLNEEEQERRIAEHLKADRKRGFALDQPPLMRWKLFVRGQSQFQLIWSYHHVLLDGWSMPLVWQEMITAYHRLVNQQELPLQTARPYKEYIAWLMNQDPKKAEQFWRKKLQGYTTPLSLEVELPQKERTEPSPQQHEMRLSMDLTEKLTQFARQHQCTLNTLVQGAWAILLSVYSGEVDLVYGATGAGRPAELPGVEEMVGLFINTIPVRVQIDKQSAVLSWLREFQQEQVELRQYEYTPLVDLQQWSQLPQGESLFRYLYVFENYPLGEMDQKHFGQLQLEEISGSEQVNYPLALVVAPGERLWVKWMYDQQAFTEETIRQMGEQLQRLLTQIVEAPFTRIGDLSLLDRAEREQLAKWNQTETEYPTDLLIHEMVAVRAKELPTAPAVWSEDQTLTYQELNEQANQLARYLQEHGAKPGCLLGVLIERSPQMIIAQLAILKTGASYIPIDPVYPSKRIRHIIQDASIPVVLTTAKEKARHLSEETMCEVLCLDTDEMMWSHLAKEDLNISAKVDDLCYVVYTSGSTGLPKGVQIRHRSLLNLLHWYQKTFKLSPNDRVAQMLGVAFDASVWEIWSALTSGACLYLPTEEVRISPSGLQDWFVRHGITISCVAPTMLESLYQLTWSESKLRILFTGGDQLRQYPPSDFPCDVVNLYGPTEATVLVTAAFLSAGQTASLPPIGHPIANTKLFVLDERLQPVPIGVPGELYLAGDGLAVGYLNQPEKTKAHFLEHPEFGRLFKTGDLVRFLPDGQLAFLGRVDQQVKLHGYRIELGEIEAVLQNEPTIRQAVVRTYEAKQGRKQLVAYVVTDGPTALQQQWIAHAKKHLPEYMIPTLWMRVDQFPLTTNGKIDYRALPQPTQEQTAPAFKAPRTPMEKKVAKIWSEVLQIEPIGLQDHFFALGGHSLLATQVITRVNEEFQLNLPIRTLFEKPTVAELVKQVKIELRSEFAIKR
jgi:amino acid adenylation domain-containing protein/non-ribosomal peptide synthase protein (TIGR01720 family)